MASDDNLAKEGQSQDFFSFSLWSATFWHEIAILLEGVKNRRKKLSFMGFLENCVYGCKQKFGPWTLMIYGLSASDKTPRQSLETPLIKKKIVSFTVHIRRQ